MTSRLTFDGLIAARQDRDDDRPVLVTATGRAVSAAEFDRHVGQAATWLTGQGVGRGDRVAVWLNNSHTWLALLFGAARIGAVVAAVNTRYRTAELHHILASSRARMLIFDSDDSHADFAEMIAALDMTTLPTLTALASPAGGTEIAGLAVAACSFDDLNPTPSQDAAPADPLLLFTTSGTTSKPKLVLHTQETLSLHATLCAGAYGFNQPGARYLAAMPFCGVFGLNPTLAAVAGGATVHIMPVFQVAPAIEMARANAITHFFGSDEMFRQMWEADRDGFAEARLCGFASFTPGLSETLRQMATAGLPLVGVYGASEVNAIFSIQPLALLVEQRLQGGGRPAGGDTVQIRVRNSETGALCQTGEAGMLEIRAPTNFKGYFENPEATAKALDADGYFLSGDAGFLRDDGTFVYLARNGDFVRLSGFLTDPAEIEEVIAQAPGVSKAQVVGVTHDGKTRPVAFVVAKPGATPDADAVIAHTKSKLAHYKVPLMVIMLDAFPTTESANGLKIQKTRLRDMAEARLSGDAS
ncbi:AMP-binding protein [Loktanella sp. M215]|uniref:AMP-binding protein n=1 Tax=Loktanella sp. M215 TaxID=2675431 RepID=UPI001F48BE16|nr:AMP-binding protein [Loktanella sp. M215]MCF7699870.1 AMP-binding protein [Loktanella sp. M215]